MSAARSSTIARVSPLAVIAVVWVAITILFPSKEPDQLVSSLVPGGGGTPTTNATGSTGITTSGGTAGGTTGASSATGSAPRTTAGVVGASAKPTTGGSSGGSTSAAPTGSTGGSTDEAAAAAAGLTRDGRQCAPGVLQIPVSTYATSCQPTFAGDNGGATWRGVTGEEIVIVERRFPESANSQAVGAVTEQAGVASDEEQDVVNLAYRDYMNANFELYGRQIKWVTYESQFGNSTNEAQSKGREEACLDADVVANELGAFAVVGTRGGAVSGPFAECAAERGVVVLNGAAYFPEKFYAERHPYVWAYTMECERISYQVAEYIGKRLGTKNAVWAGDPIYQNSPRAYATYVPNNDEYQHCVNINARAMEQDYGIKGRSRYNYTLDVSRFPDEAARGAVQFKADGATTVVLACDPISIIFLTQAATKQAYFPEWLLIGVAAQDTDLFGQLYDQQAVDGHLFGMSQLGETEKVVGPGSEAGAMYKHITGQEMPDGASGGYISMVMIHSLLQNAGPNLTPDAIAAGAGAIPTGGAPDFAYGRTSFATNPQGGPGGDHTWVDDSREIYWTSAYVSPENGTPGTFIATYNGKRFTNGEWPAEDPPVYPEG